MSATRANSDRRSIVFFSRPSPHAVLRALKDSREGMSGRAVAREAGVNHQAGAVAIRSLEAMGLVQSGLAAGTRK